MGTHPIGPETHGEGLWFALRRFFPGALVLALALLVSGVSLALAAGGGLNLGKPANTVSPNAYFPLSGFHRIHQTLKARLRTEVLVIGESTIASGPEVWPVVKALEQFGTLTGLKPVDRPAFTLKAGDKTYAAQSASTVDWVGSRYSSRYVAFVHRDLRRYDSSQQTFVPFQTLAAVERDLYRKDAQQSPNGQASLPLIAIGDYLQVASQIITDGDFRAPPGANNLPGPFLSFSTVQSALASGQDPPDSKLIEDVNAEANIITALICHADGSQPSKVCGRAVIKKLLKHVK
jgi:hypothetical protein